ncbi:MAG: hypothetical protein IT323_06620 [Anaerolineae bacterium]|nr:hypothetical protein [Anaerolineae bacterium]
MSDASEQPVTTPDKSEAEDKPKSPKMTRYLMIAFAVPGVAIIILLLIAILGAFADSAGVANFFAILRDFFIVVLALQGILISVALVILVSQLATMISLFSNMAEPIYEELEETVTTVKGTAQFVGKNVVTPAISALSVVAGAWAFVANLLNIRRLISGGKRGR